VSHVLGSTVPRRLPRKRAFEICRYIRSTSAVLSSSGHARPLVVATYNVHSCIGTDNRYDPDRIAAVIRELDADIVALQEVGLRNRRGTLREEAAYLAQATGLEWMPGLDLISRRGTCGNLLLTRWPVKETRWIDLSVPSRQPRGALDVDISIGGRDLRVIATHLGLRLGERRRQVSQLLGAAVAAPAADGDAASVAPCILLGDLNEWRPWGGSLRPLVDACGPVGPALATFPSRCPVLPLDRVFALGGPLPVDARVHRSPLATVASDHLPLRTVLAWAEERGEAGEQAGEPASMAA
jgi:endonuclease/exonuclease/phosphatase family metal-dependent hydrolase